MSECLKCTRLIDTAGACDDCRRGQKIAIRRTRGGKMNYIVLSVLNPGYRLGPDVRDRICRMTRAGFSAREIALAIGCSQRSVVRIRSAA